MSVSSHQSPSMPFLIIVWVMVRFLLWYDASRRFRQVSRRVAARRFRLTHPAMRTTTERLEPQLAHLAGCRALQLDDLDPPGSCACQRGPMMSEHGAKIHANTNFCCFFECSVVHDYMCQSKLSDVPSASRQAVDHCRPSHSSVLESSSALALQTGEAGTLML